MRKSLEKAEEALRAAEARIAAGDLELETLRKRAADGEEERETLKCVASEGVSAASEQLLNATRDAAERVHHAEERAKEQQQQLEQVKEKLRQAFESNAAAERELETQRAAAETAQSAASLLTQERDELAASLEKSRASLSALRSSIMQEEGALSERERQRVAAEVAAAQAEGRAAVAEAALKQQTTAAARLQALLDEVRSQPPEEESEPLRIGGRLLAAELRLSEDQCYEACAARGSAEGRLVELEATLAGAEEQRLKLEALVERLGPPTAEPAGAEPVDRQVLAELLVRFAGSNSEQAHDEGVLSVIASMLACTDAQREALGLGHKLDARQLGEMWADFLEMESSH